MQISERVVKGQKLRLLQEQPINSETLLERANAEGCVLLENDGMLPLEKGDKVAIFGRMQMDYYKSGTGSGGMVNTDYVPNIYESLKKSGMLQLNESLSNMYASWITRNPHDSGDGWTEPWSQKGMRLTSNMVRKAADKCDKAIIIIARTAGEDRDNAAKEGSYLFSKSEQKMIKLVSETFPQTCVVLNTGGIVDMKWVKDYNVNAVLYVWQGGQAGGQAVADVLLGKAYPSGRLTDTIVLNIGDYASYKGFNYEEAIPYMDDVFMGYRYFETLARDRVLYPFGYGLGYTTFFITCENTVLNGDNFSATFKVKNSGRFPGKEVVQMYFSSAMPNSPSRQLIAFAKTKETQPDDETLVDISFDINDMAAYDEKTHCYKLVKGEYKIYAGANVRDAQHIFTYVCEEDKVLRKCIATFPTITQLKRIVNENGRIGDEILPPQESRKGEPREPFAEIPYTGDKGIKLADVYNGKAAMTDFIAQLDTFDLACLSQGEGMNSRRVRPGTGGAIGGVTDKLVDFGIPAICVTDGPSGLRLDNGDKATSLPSATMLACTWNTKLVEDLYTYLGMEAYAHKIDALLGPGVNLHRVPLCGRNFEYFSEDPYLSGAMGAAACRGLDKSGVTAVIKHFAANNREANRKRVSATVTERALRELYFKPFEIILKTGCVRMIMTAYNRINGVYCAGNSALADDLLRGEWGYEWLTMTDWWANTSMDEDGTPTEDRVSQIRSHNDVFMVNEDVTVPAKDIVKAVEDGRLTVAELQRNAVCICRTIMATPTFDRLVGGNT